MNKIDTTDTGPLTLPAGAELDSLIAPLMGYRDPIEVSEAQSLKSAKTWFTAFRTRARDGSYRSSLYTYHVTRDGLKIGHGQPFEIYSAPDYSRSYDHAMKLWLRLYDVGITLAVYRDGHGAFCATTDPLYFVRPAGTLPLLICRVALVPAIRARLEEAPTDA